jgi:hypothetical protein
LPEFKTVTEPLIDNGLSWKRYRDVCSKGAWYGGQRGTLFQATVNHGDFFRNITFRRTHYIGPHERILTADPIELNSHEWEMFVDRGHGLHATSMVTQSIASLGLYIAEVEKEYDIYSKEDLDNLKNKDLAAYQKYCLVQCGQAELKKLYERERKLDPNNLKAVADFKTALINTLASLRTEVFGVAARHKVGAGRADHFIGAAEDRIKGFEFPTTKNGKRRKRLSKKDQLLAKKGKTYLYCPDDDVSQAAGSQMMPTIKGFSAQSRDNFAHCVMRMDGFPEGARESFKDNVKALLESKGMATPQVKAVSRSTYDHSAGNTIIGDAPNVHRRINPFNKKKGFKTHEKGWRDEPDGVVDSSVDPGLDRKASQLIWRGPTSGATAIKISSAIDSINAMENLFDKSVCDDSKLSSPEKHKMYATALMKNVISLDETEFENFLKSCPKKSINQLVAPYGSYQQLIHERKLYQAQIKYEEKFKQAYEDAIKDGKTSQDALDVENNKTQDLKENLVNLQIERLTPESGQGPTFLRASLFGSLYTIGDAIVNVIENMGLHDPIYGTIALGVMGASAMFAGAVAAHGSVASAVAKSHFMADLAKTKFIPAFYQGVMPIEKGAGAFHVAFAAFVDGLVTGKATYIALSLADSTLTGKSGFSTNLLNAIATNPLESGVVAGILFGAGWGAVHAAGAVKDLGNWTQFDELTDSLKPVAISLDVGLALYRSAKSSKGDNEGVAWKEADKRMADYMLRVICGRLKGDDELDAGEKKSLLDALEMALEKNKMTGGAEQKGGQLAALIQSVDGYMRYSWKEKGKSDKLGKVLSAMNTEPKVQEGKAVSEAMQQEVRNMTSNEFVVNSTKTLTGDPALYDHFRKTYLDAAKTREAKLQSTQSGFHSGLKQSLLATPLRFAHGVVVGLPASIISRTVLKAMNFFGKKPDYKTLKIADKWLGVDNLKAISEGGAKFMTMVGRVPASVARIVFTAGSRLVSRLTYGKDNRLKILRASADVTEKGLTWTRRFASWVQRKASFKPADVSIYRNAVTEVGEMEGAGNSELKKEAEIQLNVMRKILKAVNPKLLINFERQFKGQDESKSVLAILKAIFPEEAKQLEQRTNSLDKVTAGTRNSEEDKNEQFKILQKLFKDEVMVKFEAGDKRFVEKLKKMCSEEPENQSLEALTGMLGDQWPTKTTREECAEQVKESTNVFRKVGDALHKSETSLSETNSDAMMLPGLGGANKYEEPQNDVKEPFEEKNPQDQAGQGDSEIEEEGGSDGKEGLDEEEEHGPGT